VKKLLLFCATLSLTGCATFTAPVVAKFPEAPPVLMEKCEPLDTITQEQIVFSDFLKTVTKNYTKHHQCAKMVEHWQDWYKQQKEIFDNIGKTKK
jgi:hypothetical protein